MLANRKKMSAVSFKTKKFGQNSDVLIAIIVLKFSEYKCLNKMNWLRECELYRRGSKISRMFLKCLRHLSDFDIFG
jgi:hypothetical protein